MTTEVEVKEISQIQTHLINNPKSIALCGANSRAKGNSIEYSFSIEADLLDKLPKILKESSLSNLKIFNLGATSEQLVDIIRSIFELRELSLNKCKINDGTIREAFRELKNLNSLEIQGCGAMQSESFHHILLNGSKLRNLSLSDSNIGVKDLRDVGDYLPELRKISLGSFDVDGGIAVDCVKRLRKLESLGLVNSNLTDSDLRKISINHPELKILNVPGGKIRGVEIEKTLQNLVKLKYLGIDNNHLTKDACEKILNHALYYGMSGLGIQGNRAAEDILPIEIINSREYGQIIAAWQSYKEAKDNNTLEALNEAKLIVVGNEAVGKTSLIRYLIDDLICDPHEQKTPGINQHEQIDTTHWSQKISDIKLNVWDFGGQEIMHGTHRYFLTNRSVYLLVLEDRREDDPPVQPWMRVISSIAGDSPVIVVINKADEDKAALQLDEDGLKRTFPQIVAIVRTSCLDGDWAKTSIENLRETIAGVTNNDERLDHVRSPIPRNWLAVKEAVSRKARECSILTRQEFSEICVDEELTKGSPIVEADVQRALLRQLHELGVVIAHGIDRASPAALEAVTLLDPNWLTDAIYKILNSTKLRESGGEFSKKSLEEWLNPVDYPIEQHEYILQMMQHRSVGLCFDIPNAPDCFLAPEALPRNSPDFIGWHEGSLRFRYRFGFLPAAFVPRLIVSMHGSLTEPRTVWRTGGKFKIDGCEVLIEGNRDDRVIDLSIKGARAKMALAVVRHQIQILRNTFADLEVSERVPMPDDPAVEEDYDHLVTIEMEEGGTADIRPTGSKRRYQVSELLDVVGREGGPVYTKTTDDAVQMSRSNEKNSDERAAVSVWSEYIWVFAGIISATIGYMEFGLSELWSVSLGLIFSIFTRLFVRYFDRKMFFRRICASWITVGVGLYGVGQLAVSLNLGFLDVQFGGEPDVILVGCWVIVSILLLILAFREAKTAGDA